jgi:hypothetical protein
MKYEDVKCTKSVCEKYTLIFNNKWDWAIFTIDNTGMFNCQSSFGNYNYHWSHFGNCFKSFLINLDSGYLFTKLCNKNYFDFDEYLKSSKKVIFRMRKENEITKQQAKDLYHYFTNELDQSGYEIVSYQIWESKLVNEVCNGYLPDSEFMPRKNYDMSQRMFVKDIYPMFIEVLKQELNQELKAV